MRGNRVICMASVLVTILLGIAHGTLAQGFLTDRQVEAFLGAYPSIAKFADKNAAAFDRAGARATPRRGATGRMPRRSRRSKASESITSSRHWCARMDLPTQKSSPVSPIGSYGPIPPR